MTVVHCKRDVYDVYIGRTANGMQSEGWGNPFKLSAEEPRGATIAKYREWLWKQIVEGDISVESLAELDGKVLGCWCAPHACHGDVLAKAARWASESLLARQVAQVATVPKNVCEKCGAPTRCNVRGTWLCTPHAKEEM